MEKRITQTWHFNNSPQDVWEYLTKPELLEQWLGKTDFKAVTGHKFSLDGKNGCIIYCEVLEVKPFSKLLYSWKTLSAKDNKYFDSQVAWMLIPKENGTELQLVHEGFIIMEDVISHTKGWNVCIERLNAILKHAGTKN
ncbi:MAG: SRPBCC domain-containing protein [Bacteroidetes bacterium]|nr:SRPBCC domain-containing protein [Bacteroidota bacterium]